MIKLAYPQLKADKKTSLKYQIPIFFRNFVEKSFKKVDLMKLKISFIIKYLYKAPQLIQFMLKIRSSVPKKIPESHKKQTNS